VGAMYASSPGRAVGLTVEVTAAVRVESVVVCVGVSGNGGKVWAESSLDSSRTV
jgi:hypothetical protein